MKFKSLTTLPVVIVTVSVPPSTDKRKVPPNETLVPVEIVRVPVAPAYNAFMMGVPVMDQYRDLFNSDNSFTA